MAVERMREKKQKFPDRMSLPELARQIMAEGKAHSDSINAVVNELFKAKTYLDIDFSKAITSENAAYYPMPEIEKISATYLSKEYKAKEDEEDDGVNLS